MNQNKNIWTILKNIEKSLEENKKMLEENGKKIEENRKKYEKLREEHAKMLEDNKTIIEEMRNSFYINNLSREFCNNDNVESFIEEKEVTEQLIKNINEENCLICLEKYSIGDKICYLPCLHLFHFFCIKKWIKIKNRCPLCNVSIKSNN